MTCPAKTCDRRCTAPTCTCPPCSCSDCRARADDGRRRTVQLRAHRAAAASRAWLYPAAGAGVAPQMFAGPADRELPLWRPPVVEQVPLFEAGTIQP